MKGNRRGLMPYMLAVLWITGVFAGYYAVHKPAVAGTFPLIASEFGRLLQPWSAPALVDTAVNLVVALWLGLVAYGVGRFLVQAARLDLTWLERSILSTSLGLGIVSLASFSLGLVGLLHPSVFYSLFVAASLAIVGTSVKHRGAKAQRPLRKLSSCLRAFVFENRVIFALAVFIALTEALALLAALTPPWAWDSLVYHLTGPELYLRQGRIAGGLDGMHFYFPPLVEMLFLSGMAMKGPIVANLVHWEFGLLAVGAVFCLARRLSGIHVAWLASAILLSAPSIVILSSKAYVDLALLLYLTLAFWCVLEGFGDGRRSWFLLAAAFLGFAAGVKYTGMVGMLAIGAVIALEMALTRLPAILLRKTTSGVRQQEAEASAGAGRGRGPAKASTSKMGEQDVEASAGERHRDWRLVAGCLLVIAILAAPWYLKNLFFAGNPFYPFLFGGQFWDSFRGEWVARGGSGLLAQPWRLIFAPLEMTILGVEGGWGYQASIGPLFLALLPWIRVEGRGGRASAVFVGVMYTTWLGGVAQSELLRQTRLLFPAFGFLAVLVALPVYRLRPTSALDLRRFVGGAIALALALSLATQVFAFLTGSPLPVIVGAESQETYLARHLGGYYETAAFVNGSLGEDARVYFLWEPRSYYFQRPVQPDTILDNWRHLLFLNGGSDAIAATLRGQGYTHVLINLDGLRYFGADPRREVDRDHLDALLEFERRHLKLVYGDKVEGNYPSSGGESGIGSYSLSRLE